MAKCKNCGRSMLFSSQSGYCKQCSVELLKKMDNSQGASKMSGNGNNSGLHIPEPVRKSNNLLSYIDTIYENDPLIDRCLLHERGVRKIVDGQKCIITPLYHCYLYRDPVLKDGFFIVGAALTIERSMFYLCLERNPSTGQLKTFWVGARDRIEDGSDLEGDLNYHMIEMLPNWKAWLMDYISTEA